MAEGNALGAVFNGQTNTSSYSNPTVNALLAGGGSGANSMTGAESNALGVAQQVQQLQSGKVTIDQQTFNLAKAKLDAVHQLLGAVVANPTDDTFTTQLGIGVKAGTVDPQTAADLASHVASFGGNRQQIQQFALDGLNNNASHQEILQQAYGTPGLANTGGSLVSTQSRTGPNGGVTLSGTPAIPTTTSPGERMGGITTKNPDGSSTFRPNSTLYDSQGNFIGAGGGGSGSAPSIPVYRGGIGGGSPPAAGAVGQGSAPSAPATSAAPVAPQGAALGSQDGGGGRVAVGYPASSGADSGTQATVPANGASAGGAAHAVGQGAASVGMWTPGPQTMPVVTLEQAQAAAARAQSPQGTAADRNLLRGYAVQNNIPLQGKDASTWEPQPGQAPQSAGQGGAPAAPAPASGAVPPGRQPPTSVQAPGAAQPQGQAPAAGQGSFGSRFGVQSGQGAGLTTGLSPGQEASLKAGADGYSALSSDVSNPSGVNQRLFQLRTALGALRNTQTGLGTQQRQQLVGYLASLPGGLAKWAPGVDPDSASSYDIATKYLTAYSLNTPGAARSDAGLSTAQSANANTSGMMQKAAQDVTLSNIGLENGKRALLNSFNASGADPGTFGKFASQWMQGTDPRAFALPDMTPAERGQLYTSLQGPAKAAFLATVKKGMAAKILTPNDLQGAAGNGQ